MSNKLEELVVRTRKITMTSGRSQRSSGAALPTAIPTSRTAKSRARWLPRRIGRLNSNRSDAGA